MVYKKIRLTLLLVFIFVLLGTVGFVRYVSLKEVIEGKIYIEIADDVINTFFKLIVTDEMGIPDISNLSSVDATNKLVEEGFEPTCRDNENNKIDYKYEASDEIKEGYAIKTTPSAGTLAKEGREVCIILSSGDASFEMEDYTGRNYIEVKNLLEERYKVNVIVEKQKVKEEDKKEENSVIGTKPAVGETVKNGSTITLYIPEVEVVYPNFADGSYTVDKVREFAEKYKLHLTINEEENGVLTPGTIISQSRPAGNPVQEGVAFTITVVKASRNGDYNE